MSEVYWEFTGETRIELGGWISDKVQLVQNGLGWIGRRAKAFGGTIEGGDFLAVLPIGSENGQFTAEVMEDGKIICNRGCFTGTLDEFEAAVFDTHGNNQTADEYGLVIQLVRMRLEPIAIQRRQKREAA